MQLQFFGAVDTTGTSLLQGVYESTKTPSRVRRIITAVVVRGVSRNTVSGLVLVIDLTKFVFAFTNTGRIEKRDPRTRLVLWGTRHGNRNPEQFVKMNPPTWGFEGSVELTQFGKRQSYALGRELRQFIGNLVDGNYLPKQATYYSSSANRCQMSLQTTLAGFYSPTGWADWKRPQFDFWSPVPYSINDPLLRMYAVKDCPQSDRAWKPISDDTLPDLRLLAARNKHLLEYIAKNTGWTPTISSAADLADNIIEMDLYKAPYPAWMVRPTLRGYNNVTFKRAVQSFGEKHQIRCTNYAPCRNLMGGVWLKHLLDSLSSAVKGEGPSVIGYTSHTEVTLAVMKLMGIEKHELTTAAGFIIEYRNKPAPSIRLLNHDPVHIDGHTIYRAKYTADLTNIADKAGWIPLNKFTALVGRSTISDWEKACGKQQCSAALPSSRQTRADALLPSRARSTYGSSDV